MHSLRMQVATPAGAEPGEGFRWSQVELTVVLCTGSPSIWTQVLMGCTFVKLADENKLGDLLIHRQGKGCNSEGPSQA